MEQTRSSLNLTDSLIAYPYTYEQDMELLAQIGYDTTNVIISNDVYYLESKYRFSKEALNQVRNSEQRPRLNPTGNRVLSLENQHIMIILNTGSYYNYNSYIEEAVDAWNEQLDCNLDIQINTRSYDNEYLHNQVSFQVGYDAPEVPFVSLYENINDVNAPHRGIYINTNHSYWWIVCSYSQITYLAMHAIGELIGLKPIYNTNNIYLDRSIMLDDELLGELNMLWEGFSLNDINSLEAMYPIPETTFSYEWSGSDSNSLLVCPINNTISVNVTQSGGNQIDYSLEYTVDADESDYTVGEWGNTLEFQFLEAGTYTVTITPVADEETFASETFEIEAYDIPEMSYSWSPALQSGNKLQIDEPYNITIDGIGSQYDLSIGIKAETAGSQYSCTEINPRSFQLVFDNTGTYNITLTVKMGTKTLITEKFVIVAIDEPTFDFSWDPTPKNSQNKLLKEETYTLSINNLKENYSVQLGVNPEAEGMEYLLSKTDARNFDLTFNESGTFDVVVNVFNEETFTLSKTIKVRAIDAPSLNPAWSSPTEIGEYFSLNTNYTLNLNYVNEYYNNSNGFTYDYMVKYRRIDDNVLVDKTTTVLMSKNGQQAQFNFNLPGEYLITASIKYGSALVDTYETTCRVVGGRIVMNNGDDEAVLNIPYSFIYYYWHPEHQNVTYEFRFSEELFDMGSTNNIIYDQDRENAFMVSFRDYGCYYIEAIVKEGYSVCDRKIINFTKLYRPDPCTFELYEIKANPNPGQEVSMLFKYKLHLGAGSNITERFYGEVQRVKEIRKAFYIGQERRVDREFTYYMHPILLPKESLTTLELFDGGLGRTITPFDTHEVYYTYNGYIYYPKDRVGLANSTNPEDLPREGVKYEVINTSGVMGIDL